MADDNEIFPPQVPCPGECAYADECGGPSIYGDPGCGGCCGCANACHLEYDIMKAYTPVTKKQHEDRLRWEKYLAETPGPIIQAYA